MPPLPRRRTAKARAPLQVHALPLRGATAIHSVGPSQNVPVRSIGQGLTPSPLPAKPPAPVPAGSAHRPARHTPARTLGSLPCPLYQTAAPLTLCSVPTELGSAPRKPVRRATSSPVPRTASLLRQHRQPAWHDRHRWLPARVQRCSVVSQEPARHSVPPPLQPRKADSQRRYSNSFSST